MVPYEIPPGRPIVSDCSSSTYNISQYTDLFLGPLSNWHPSYLKDTYHFLQTIRPMVVPEQAFLFTIDIDSLHTNINTQMGLAAVKETSFWDTRMLSAQIRRFSNCWNSVLPITIFNLTIIITYRLRARPWGRDMHRHMLIFIWASGKRWPNAHCNPYSISGFWMIL